MAKLNLNSPEMTKLLKDSYLPAFETETWTNAGALSESFGMKGIGGSINATSGKLDVYFKKGRAASAGAFGDDNTFAKSTTKSVGDEAVIRTRGFQANAGISVIANQRLSGPDAWENIFDNQFEELTDTLKTQYARMLYGDGSGVMATVEVAATGAASDGLSEIIVSDIRKFRIGDLVSFGTVSADSPKGKQPAGIDYVEADQEVKSRNKWATHGLGNSTLLSFRIDDIDYAKSAIYVVEFDENDTAKASVTTVATKNAEIFYRNSVHSDIHGLGYIIKNEAGKSGYFGLGETEYGSGTGTRPRYLNSHITKVTNFLTEDAFMKHYEDQELLGGNIAPDLMITSRGTRRSIASSNQGATTSIVRVMRDSTKSAANDVRTMGYAGVDLKGESIEVDRMAPTGKLWALKLETFDMANEQDLTFDDTDGMTWKQVIGTDGGRSLQYAANMYAYRELFNKNPRANGFIEIDKAQVLTPDFSGKPVVGASELGKTGAAGTAPVA